MYELIFGMVNTDPEERTTLKDSLEILTKMKTKLKSQESTRKKINKYEKLETSEIHIVQDDFSRQYFKAYIRTEYAVEGLLFFEDVQVFQKLKSDQERILKAKEICGWRSKRTTISIFC